MRFARSGVRQFQVAEPQSLRSTVLFDEYRFHFQFSREKICFLSRTSVRAKELRVELFVYLRHLFAGEAAVGGEVGDRLEVVILFSG